MAATLRRDREINEDAALERPEAEHEREEAESQAGIIPA